MMFYTNEYFIILTNFCIIPAPGFPNDLKLFFVTLDLKVQLPFNYVFTCGFLYKFLIPSIRKRVELEELSAYLFLGCKLIIV